jgi:hypothetical protein
VNCQLVSGNSSKAAFAGRRQRRCIDQRHRDRGKFFPPNRSVWVLPPPNAVSSR